eukprot:6187362-Pleurochrysis_carterae.AAC.3
MVTSHSSVEAISIETGLFVRRAPAEESIAPGSSLRDRCAEISRRRRCARGAAVLGHELQQPSKSRPNGTAEATAAAQRRRGGADAPPT